MRGRAERAGRRRVDAVSVLTLYLVLLFCIESRLVIAPLGATGSPALLVACAGFAWWVCHQVQRPTPTGHGRQPVRTALLVLLLAFLASFAAALSRPIQSLEVGTAQIGLVMLVGCMGVALLAHDGVTSWDRMELLVTRLVLLTTALAALGIAQFLADDPLIRSISIPGLTPNAPLGGINLRGGFSRPFGTAVHPIEFGAVLTTVLPLAIVWGRTTTVLRAVRWLPVSLLGLGVVVSISRSALVCGVAALAILAAGWDRRARQAMLAGVVAVVAVVAVAMPGMVGSITALFVTAGEDTSVESRTGSYPLAFEVFSSSPVFGRGYSTFLPVYRIFDNQYLLLLVEVGIVGLVSFVALVVTAAVAARRARTLSDVPVVRDYAQGILAAVCSGALGLAFFDGFSFPMSTGVLFLVLGLAGAMLRLAADDPETAPESDPGRRDEPRLSRRHT